MLVSGSIWVVRKKRLELLRREALEPKSSASTNSATFAPSISGAAIIACKKNQGKNSAANVDNNTSLRMTTKHVVKDFRQQLESERLGNLVQLVWTPFIC